MCPCTLLILVSTLPIGMAVAGSHGPAGEGISNKDNLPSEQPFHAIAALVRRSRLENPRLTSLYIWAAFFALGFFIMRCFISMVSRKTHKHGIDSRRLASRFDNMCSEEEGRPQSFLDRAKDRAIWRRLKTPAILVGAGALVGAAITAGISAGINNNNNNNNNQLSHGAPLAPLAPLAPIPPLASLMAQLPNQDIKIGTVTLHLSEVNKPLTRYLISILAIGKAKSTASDELKSTASDELTEFFKFLIKDTKISEEETKLAEEYKKKIEEIVEKAIDMPMLTELALMTKLARNYEDDEDYEDYEDYEPYEPYEPDEPPTKLPTLEERLIKLFPDEKVMVVKGQGAAAPIYVGKMMEDLANYIIITFALIEEPDEEALKTELTTVSNFIIRKVFNTTRMRNVLANPEKEAKELAEEYKKTINTNINNIVEEGKLVAAEARQAARQAEARKERHARAAAEAAKHVTPTVANTVKAIQAGKFTLE